MAYGATNPYNINAAPRDQEAKMALRRALGTLSTAELEARLDRQIREGMPKQAYSDLPDDALKRVLDSTAGTTGNVLPRVDLEQTIYSLFVRKFPWFEAIRKAPSNGLLHT